MRQLLAELRNELAVAAVDAQRHAKPDVLDGRDIGQRRMQILVAAEQPEHDRGERAMKRVRAAREAGTRGNVASQQKILSPCFTLALKRALA